MRRAIAAAITGGVVLGGALASPAFAVTHSADKGTVKERHKATKTVVYGGYEFQVPASWPVYRLDQHPQTCVRYDVNAVYLGPPGTGMQCPAGLVGRAQTVSFAPAAPAATRTGGSLRPDGPGPEIQRLSAVNSAITQNSAQRELRVALGGGHGATVTGTYGTDPAAVRQVLSTLHKAPAGAPDSAQSAPARQPARSLTSRAGLSQPHPAAAAPAKPAPAAPAAAPSPTYTSWKGVPSHWPVQIIAPKPKPTPAPVVKPVGGFDTCTAPSLAAMRAFRSNYAVAGIYIGGANTGCAYGNLSASWIRSAAAMGYGMLPTYVGRQAPCWNGNGLLISAASAAAQGQSAGADAVSDAQSFRLAKGSPIYYDMEAYQGGASCKNAVLTFLGAWDRRVVAGGYVTGVYSSEDSGIIDMQAAAVAGKAGFSPPDAVWIALWDNNATLSDGILQWPLTKRNKQYTGNANVTLGGFTLNLDKDIVGGPVAR
jgi:hypothetical protein